MWYCASFEHEIGVIDIKTLIVYSGWLENKRESKTGCGLTSSKRGFARTFARPCHPWVKAFLYRAEVIVLHTDSDKTLALILEKLM